MTASLPIRPGVMVGAGVAAAASAATVALGILGWRALRHLDAVEVVGRSMSPSLEPGDRLLVETWTFGRRAPKIGDVVVAPDPREPTRELVKRVAAVDTERVALRGDSAKSTDSRRFGTVPVTDVRARAAFRYWPPARVGPIPAVDLPLDGELAEVSD